MISSRILRKLLKSTSPNYTLSTMAANRSGKHRQKLILSKSANAFWNRKSKSKMKQRNNSTKSRSESMKVSHLRHFRKSLVEKFKFHKRSTTSNHSATSTNQQNSHTDDLDECKSLGQTELKKSSVDQSDIQYHAYSSSKFLDFNDTKSIDNHANMIEPFIISSLQGEQQNINATGTTIRSMQTASSTVMNEIDSPRKVQRKPISRAKYSKNNKRKTSARSTKVTISNQQKVIPKRNKWMLGESNVSCFLPQLEHSDEITLDNVRNNHLCCKPITSVKNLALDDQKKLIEHDHLTFISLLPIYLNSQKKFHQTIRDKTNISSDGALELEQLMNAWSSARLFIGPYNNYTILSQKI